MNKRYILAIFIFLSVGTASSQTPENWNKDQIDQLIEQVRSNGHQKAEGEIELLLPQVGSISLLGDQVLGFNYENNLEVFGFGRSFYFFIEEPARFKGNLAKARYFFRYPEKEQDEYINEALEFLNDLTLNPPQKVVPLFAGKDELTKSFREFVEKIEKTADKSKSMISLDIRTQDGADITYFHHSKENDGRINIFYRNHASNKSYDIVFNLMRPLLEGTYEFQGKRRLITKEILQTLIQSVK